MRDNKHGMDKVDLGHGAIVLRGRYNYDAEIGWTMDYHVRLYLSTHEVVSHCVYGHDLALNYSVIMRLK